MQLTRGNCLHIQMTNLGIMPMRENILWFPVGTSHYYDNGGLVETILTQDNSLAEIVANLGTSSG